MVEYIIEKIEADVSEDIFQDIKNFILYLNF
jgi:hypothetical protein